MPYSDPRKAKEKAHEYYLRGKERQITKQREKYHADIEKSRAAGRDKKNRFDASEKGKSARRQYRRRIAEANSKAYRTGEEVRAGKVRRNAEKEKRRAERASRETCRDRWIRRLKEELPELYNESASRLALEWRAKYHLDPVFKAREIERTAKRDARRPLLDDGSLTPEVVCSLFSRKVCPYCGKKMASSDKTLDHIIPRHLGGWHSSRNVTVCCYGCNSRKQARAPEVWIKMVPIEKQGVVMALWDRVTGTGARQMWLAS